MSTQIVTEQQKINVPPIFNLKQLLRKQLMMRRVLVSLLPIMLFSIYLFGWRTLSVVIIVTIAGLITEYLFEKQRQAKPTESVLVTCFLYALILPNTIPYWTAILGIVFGIVFAKQVFGGFGKNVFNPALVGRCFVFITFAGPMTNNWTQPFKTFPGGFAQWTTHAVDAVTKSTPIAAVKGEALGHSYWELFIGNIPGSMGETSALLILIAGIYLVYKKVASWQIMLSVMLSFVTFTTILWATGSSQFHNPIAAILTGGFLFGTVFMATDPVTAPKQTRAKIIYGILIGIVAVIIREFALFPEGMMFAILIVNTFVPLIDIATKSLKRGVAA